MTVDAVRACLGDLCLPTGTVVGLMFACWAVSVVWTSLAVSGAMGRHRTRLDVNVDGSAEAVCTCGWLSSRYPPRPGGSATGEELARAAARRHQRGRPAGHRAAKRMLDRRMPEDHLTTGIDRGPHGWAVACSCGWRADVPTERAARSKATRHVRAQRRAHPRDADTDTVLAAVKARHHREDAA
jgi:hypothetical protein